MYKKARANEIKNFTGISDPYEAPENPDLILDTEKETLEQSVQNLLNFLKSKNLV
jgi:adenylylsulfate kinase